MWGNVQHAWRRILLFSKIFVTHLPVLVVLMMMAPIQKHASTASRSAIPVLLKICAFHVLQQGQTLTFRVINVFLCAWMGLELKIMCASPVFHHVKLAINQMLQAAYPVKPVFFSVETRKSVNKFVLKVNMERYHRTHAKIVLHPVRPV